eukprot:gene11591-biopygen5795
MLISSGKLRYFDGTKQLGVGGFGEVHLALYQNKKVAVKSFYSLRGSRLSLAQKDVAAVENEVLLMGGYLGSHPTIVSCYGYFKDEHQNISMVMELAPYGCLSTMLDDCDSFPILSFRLVLGWLNDLIDALCYIHEHEVKHRDVKADNLLLFANLDAKLCDFGLARQHSSQRQSATSAAGTFDFLAPEVMNGKGSSYASDVFSWAMTAAHMILRRVPDRRNDLPSLINQVLLEECLETEPTKRPSASTVSASVQKMLDKAGGDPRHKYTSDDKSHIEAIARSADEKSSSHIVARLSSPLSSPLKDLLLQIEESLQQMATSGEVSVLQELEAMRSIAEIPAEDINRTFRTSLSDDQWGLEEVTALHISAAKGHVEMLKLLLLHPKVAVNTSDSKDGCTPLNIACCEGCVEVVQILLLHGGVDVTKADKYGCTPFYIACERGHLEVVKVLLSDSRVDINKSNKDGGRTPLNVASREGHVEVVKVLLSDGRVDVNKATNYGWTPLSSACLKDQLEVVKVLLADSRVDVNKAAKVDEAFMG